MCLAVPPWWAISEVINSLRWVLSDWFSGLGRDEIRRIDLITLTLGFNYLQSLWVGFPFMYNFYERTKYVFAWLRLLKIARWISVFFHPLTSFFHINSKRHNHELEPSDQNFERHVAFADSCRHWEHVIDRYAYCIIRSLQSYACFEMKWNIAQRDCCDNCDNSQRLDRFHGIWLSWTSKMDLTLMTKTIIERFCFNWSKKSESFEKCENVVSLNISFIHQFRGDFDHSVRLHGFFRSIGNRQNPSNGLQKRPFSTYSICDEILQGNIFHRFCSM